MVTLMISGNPQPVYRLVKALEGTDIKFFVNDHKLSGFFEKFSHVIKSDIISICSIKPNGLEGITWIFIFILLKIINKPVVLRWVGTDVTELSLIHAFIFSKLVNTHLAVSPWLVDELETKGIKAEWLFIPPVIKPDREYPLPQEFTVLSYFGERRNKFYGSDIVEKLAENMPDTHFIIVGEPEKKLCLPNIKYYGFVTPEKMADLYTQSTVLVRLTRHEGLGLMVIEALSYGRHVIFSHIFPECFYAKTYDECFKLLNDLKSTKTLNIAGMKYVEDTYKMDFWVKKHIELYKKIAGDKK